jgi:hypothetical protein
MVTDKLREKVGELRHDLGEVKEQVRQLPPPNKNHDEIPALGQVSDHPPTARFTGRPIGYLTVFCAGRGSIFRPHPIRIVTRARRANDWTVPHRMTKELSGGR